MSNFVIKGTVLGHTYEKWRNDKDTLSSVLISVMSTWEMNNSFNNKISTNLMREYGKVVNAYSGFMNDIHNLAITLDMIESNLEDKSLDFWKKLLYITLLVEVYFTNLRTIYDFTSYFPKVLIDEKNFSHLPSKKEGSIKELIKFLKKENAKEVLSQEIIDVFINCESNLDDVRNIRDMIIHKGKEPILFIDNDDEVKISINSKENNINLLPNILNEQEQAYDLKKYLSKITNNLFDFIESLGEAMYQEFFKRDPNYGIYLGELTGICITNFIEFLGWGE